MDNITTQLVESFERFLDIVIRNAPAIFIGIILLVIFLFVASGLRSLTQKRLTRRIEDKLLVNFIGRMVFLFVSAFGVVIFLNQIGLGKAASGLLAGAGVSAIVIGFAFKDIGENFLAGFFLAFSRPFSIGDTIEVLELKGVVKALNFRNTHIRTFDGKDIFLPNSSLIKSPLINYTRDGLLRYDFLIGIDYGDDIAAVGKLIIDTLSAERRIEHSPDLKPFILIEEFGTSTVNIRTYYWVNSQRYEGSVAVLQNDVMNGIVSSLMKQGYSLPADIVELKIYQEGKPIPLNITSSK
ncbi:mechanosensitive ion channel family protein [Imperialibacter roseus]|uniref:Mechanosensitive ion channel family protein n=1 Tax=Imperialibacter roseus TaxID=1324217 RepID=A0ABZ0ILY6_9BACT|nr:mechanosensitive ion channel family protein [Imperialibacter roseus]WOK06034.1 mechanosensitive ion channel family protein [Imperialibacter roseus]